MIVAEIAYPVYTASKRQHKNKVDERIRFVRVGFIENCHGVGEAWFHPEQFQEAKSIYVVSVSRKRLQIDAQDEDGENRTLKRRKVLKIVKI